MTYKKFTVDVNCDILQACGVHYLVDVISGTGRKYDISAALVTFLERIKDVLCIICAISVGGHRAGVYSFLNTRLCVAEAALAQ